MRSALFKNDYDRISSWVNMNICKYVSIENTGIVLHFLDNTAYLIVSSDCLEKVNVDSKDILVAIMDKFWGSSDDAIIDIDEIIKTLQKKE